MQQNNNRYQPGGPSMNTAAYQHRNVQGKNGNDTAVNGEAAAVPAGINAGIATPNYDMYAANGSEEISRQPLQQPAQQQQQVQQQPPQVPVYSNLNSAAPYPVAPSPNAGVYSGQYMVDANSMNTQNIIGKNL